MKDTSNTVSDMGSCNGKNSVPTDVYSPPTLEEILQDFTHDLELSSNEKITYSFHIYLYQKQMREKDCELLGWCGSKLALTEDIIRINQSRLQSNISSVDANAQDNIFHEIEQLQEYRKKLVKVMKHLRKLNNKTTSYRRVRKKRSHKCAVKMIAALTEAIS